MDFSLSFISKGIYLILFFKTKERLLGLTDSDRCEPYKGLYLCLINQVIPSSESRFIPRCVNRRHSRLNLVTSVSHR